MLKINKRTYKICFFMILIILNFNVLSLSKYIFDNTYTIAQIDIDRRPPEIELIKITNTNVGYENYANKTHIITAQIKVIEKNIKENNFNSKNIKILIDKNQIIPSNYEIKRLIGNADSIVYEIKLNNLMGDGDLEIEIPEGVIKDKSNNVNIKKIFNTNIKIDNTAPRATFNEVEIESGKVLATISSNEGIREKDGWDIKEDKQSISKEFNNNVSYNFEIMDFAENKTEIEVNVTKATNIKIIYGSHNSEVGWSYGYGNYDIAGKKAVEINRIYKTEALAFNMSGNIDMDFIQARAFVYSHWGEGSQGRCSTYRTLYKYGYNPSSTTYASMETGTIVTIDSKRYFMFGGSGINASRNTDINGNNPIPEDQSGKYLYGISGIQLNLKDYSQYSIVYQILVNDYGWQKTMSDGQESMCQYNKPFSAFRMALIPKTEKEYLIKTWDEDIGTYNLR